MPNLDLFSGKTTRRKMKMLLISYIIFRDLEIAVDTLAWTPIRILQVFFDSWFSKLASITPVVFGISLAAILPFFAKAFLKQENNNLQKVSDNLKKIGIQLGDNTAANREVLANELNAILQEQGVYHITATVVSKDKYRLRNFLKKKPELSLQLKYHDTIKDFFDASWNKNKSQTISQLAHTILNKMDKEKLKKILSAITNHPEYEYENKNAGDLINLIWDEIKKDYHVLDKISQNDPSLDKDADARNRILLLTQVVGFFFDKKTKRINETITLETSLKNFIEALDKLSMADILNNGYRLINDNNFNFWIYWFIVDMITQQANTGLWSRLGLMLVLGGMATSTAIQALLRGGDYYSNKLSPEEHNLPEKMPPNKKQTHKLLLALAQTKIFAKRLLEAEEFAEKNQAALKEAIVQKNKHQPLRPTKVSRQFDLLREEADGNKIGKRIRNTLTHASNHLISLSFFGWTGGIIVGAAGATLAAAIILSPPVGLALCAAGLLVGLGFAYHSYKKDTQWEEELRKKLETNQEGIAELEALVADNKKMSAEIKQLKDEKGKPIRPLTVIKPGDDTGRRRIDPNKTGAWTMIKKGFNRAFLGIAKAGTGVLLVRLLVIPIVTIVCGAAIAGPVGLLAALALAVIWSSMNVYMYHRQHKIAAAERTLDDLPGQIEAAKQNRILHLTQLGRGAEVEELRKGKDTSYEKMFERLAVHANDRKQRSDSVDERPLSAGDYSSGSDSDSRNLNTRRSPGDSDTEPLLPSPRPT
ncbi:MAG TPA: hypothetical protein VJN02_11375 [Gammaproteobacteria bacterium]|nr:hypothetical protein [Gammaproteobacteria bacterium]